MKIKDRKISLGAGLAVLFLTSSVVYSIGYKVAMNKFNSIVSTNQEKQKMYGDLSEIDYNIKNEYIGNINEPEVFEGMYRGYISKLEDCSFFNKEEYAQEIQNKKNIPAEVSWDEIDGSIGYLRCKSLGKGSADIFIERIEYFISQGIKKIIVDFRLSEQGLVEEAFKILQYLLPEGDIVTAVTKNGEKKVVCKSTSKGISAQVAIITGENCSAASEIISSAMRDGLGAKIVGQKTKGNFFREKVVQTSENSIIRFPDAKYFTSSGTDLYKNGLEPDQASSLQEDKKELLNQENLLYEEDEQFNLAKNIFSE